MEAIQNDRRDAFPGNGSLIHSYELTLVRICKFLTDHLRWREDCLILATALMAFMLSIGPVKVAAQLTVNTVITPPYSSDLDFYIDDLSNVFITIQNTTGNTYRFRFTARITGPSGIEANIQYLGEPLEIAGFLTRMFTGNQLSDLGSSTGGFENTNNLTDEQLNAINLHHAIPDGDYTICFSAVDETGNLISDPSTGCADFTVSFIERPQIVMPADEEVVSETFTIAWMHDISSVPPSDRFRMTYRLNVIDATENDLAYYIDEVYDLNLAGTYQQETQQAMAVLRGGTDLLMTEGHEYLAFVTAFDPDGRLMFVDRGNSNIVRFYYLSRPEDEETDEVENYSGCISEEFTIGDCTAPRCEFYFPSENDTLPFTMLPLMIEFEPYCPEYRRLEYTINLVDPASGSNRYNRSDDLRWTTGGPLQYLVSQGIAGATEERARKFMLNDTWNTPAFQRARGNRAVADVRMTMDDGAVHPFVLQSNFVTGMPIPGLVSPANGAAMDPGSVEFRWDNGALPANSFPDVFYLVRMHGRTIEDASYYGEVDERWVLQIATSERFDEDSIVGAFSARIGGRNFASVEDLMTGIYRMNDRARTLSDTGDYYWRVIWLLDPSQSVPESLSGDSQREEFYFSNSEYYHSSPIRRFHIRAQTGEETPPEESRSTCASPCRFPEITSTTPSGSITAGSNFTAAGFSVEVESLESSGTGIGYLQLSFLNNVKIKFRLSGIQINASRQMIGGTLTPVIEEAFPVSEHISDLGRLLGMDEGAADAMEAGLEAGLEAGPKLLSLLSAGSKVSLPIGIDKEIGGARIVIGLMNLRVLKDSASMDLVVNIRIPNLEFVNGFISLGAQVCITPDGFGNDVRLYLPQDQVFPLGNDNEFRIKGAFGNPDRTTVTSVEWDCEGFRALNLFGAVRFTREWLLPENASGVVPASGQVEARFGGRITRGGHMMLRMDMDAFQVPGMEGWGFQPGHNCWVDLSDLENPDRLRACLPSGYTHPALASADVFNTWKGFFLEEVSIRTPERLQGPDHGRLTFAFRNIFIDNTGLSFRAAAENILRWDGDGNFNGWAASLDTVYVEIIQNNFRRAGFNGKLGIPIAETSQYMVYQAELNIRTNTEGTEGRDSINFVISVRPAENIRIPISMAEAVIRSDSYVKASLGTHNYIEANLSAILRIGSGNLPEGQSMPTTVSMPGIEVRNLRINSETGFDTRAFHYSLTGLGGSSPGGSSGGGSHFLKLNYPDWYLPEGEGESTMSGFPIGLDSFGISNDRITIKPRITLTGGEGGFSASARISLLVSMDLLSSPQRFDLTGVNLERIDLRVEASDLKLSGYLEFYKDAIDEGVKGGIQLEIKLGITVGIDINAEFGCRKLPGATRYNESSWFSYFSVDGMVVLNPGITLFSGVVLYGLGGGFFHHMNLVGNLPKGGDVLAAAGSPVGSNRAIPRDGYVPDFGTDLGLKFMVVLGSNDQGKAYNLDVTLTATFSFAHGLTMFDFRGSFRVMSNGISAATVGREDRSPIAGYVGLTLNMPPGGPTVLDGCFFVKLKVPYEMDPPILGGIGRLDSVPPGWTAEHALVWAKFFAGEDNWYFHMGTPTNRCGVRLAIGPIELLRVTNYLMVGHGVPVIMPEPDSVFLSIFERAKVSPNRVRSLDGDVDNLVAGRSRPAPPLGVGFAMGMTMVMSTVDIEFFPFFFNLTSVMGFDVNVTHATPDMDRRCAVTGTEPGIDGWYATGQFYAGIEGAFGIKINLFVEEIKVNILQACAAIILRGGLPRPEWVTGRGRFYYNVCNGLAEGDCEFVLQAGTVCEVVTGNPFSGIQIIQDISPADGAADVSVYTDVSAAFSMDMNRTFEIEEYGSPVDPPVIRRLQPYMHSFELRREGSSVNLTGTGSWSDSNHIYTFAPLSVLRAQTRHSIRVEARIRENDRDVLVRGSVFREEKIHHFTTGEEPDKIVDDNLSFTYPYISQRHFLKGETQDNEGYIRCRQSDNRCLKEGDVSNVRTSFYARFTDEDGQVTHVPVRVMPQAKGVIFNVSHLLQDKIYCLQIIRKDQPIGELNISESALRELSGPRIDPSRADRSLQVVNFAHTIGNSTVRSTQYKRIQLPSGQVKKYEVELFSYFFKTSRFLTMRQKMESEQNNWRYENVNFLGYDLGRVKKEMTESFEWVDVSNFKVVPKPNALEFSKRVEFVLQAPPDILDGRSTAMDFPVSRYLLEVTMPKIVHVYANAGLHRAEILRRHQSANPGHRYSCPELEGISGMEPYSSRVKINSASYYLRALSAGEVQDAFTEVIGSTGSASVGNISLVASRTGILSGLPGNVMSNRTTQIDYEPHIQGVEHYREVRSALVNFAHAQTTVSFGGGHSQINTYDMMTRSQQSFFNQHIGRSRSVQMVDHMGAAKGREVIGIQYLYPDQNGLNRHGSRATVSFMYN
jgi:hypothetical protein